jgi:O-antigen/teichoic acid export membrane protein
MSATRRFASALAGQWGATLYSAVLSTLLSFALGRFLGPESFGKYSYIVTVASLFAILQDGGFSILIFRETAHPSIHPAPSTSIERLAQGHCLLVTVGGLAVVWLTPLADKAALSLAVVYYGLFTAGNYLCSSLKGHGQFEREGIWRMIVRTYTVAAVLLALVVPGTGPALLFAGWIVGQITALAMPIAAQARQAPSFGLDRQLYRSCGAFLLISATTTIYFKSDIILLSQLTGDPGEVGQYAAAYRLIEAAVLFSSPLAQIFFRKLRVNMNQAAVFKRALSTQLATMSALAVAGTALALWLGPWVVRAAFGDRYVPAMSLCPWLLPSLLFILPNAILTQALIAIGREGFYARVTVLTALANITLNLALIPWLGARGSALATVATEALLAAGLVMSYLKRS